jgi:hypothetical protein
MIAAALVAIAALAVLGYRSWPEHYYQPSTRAEKAFSDAMISDLVGLRNAEVSYFREHNVYAADIDSTFFLQSPGVTKPELQVRDGGWYATVTHAQLPGVTCAMAVGTRNPLSRRTKDGEAFCR